MNYLSGLSLYISKLRMESIKSPRKTLSREIRPEGAEERKLSKRVSINSENFVMCRVGSFDDHYIVTGKIG